MTATPPGNEHPQPPASDGREPHLGLRLRLWLACLSGGAIAGLGSLWVLGTRVRPGAADPAELLAWLAGVAILAVLAGLVFALWLDHHIVGHLRGLLRGIASDRVAELRGLPGSRGWGELSQLSGAVTDLLGQQRRAARSVAEMEALRAQLGRLHDAVERWARDETWTTPLLQPGPAEDLNDWIARGIARRASVDEQNREVAAQVARELSGALADAQESAAQAERGFVEATALLTTVRELQRLSAELQSALDVLPAAQAPAPAAPPATREVLEDLVAASHESVESLGRGMLRVQDVAEQVQQMANRATLIAIHVVSSVRREEGPDGDVAAELKRLTRDVREMTDRTSQFALEVEASVAAASTRMREARESALARLEAPEAVAAPAPAANPRAFDDAQRLLERVREMVQDAARKGERLSQAGERASRAAERLARRVDEEAAESEALALRLAPVPSAPERGSAPPTVELRLLGDAPSPPEAAPAGEEQPDLPPFDVRERDVRERDVRERDVREEDRP